MKFVLLTAILFCSKISFSARSQINNADTSVPKQEYKLSKEEFLEKYGRDDSSRALIKFYFFNRNLHYSNPRVFFQDPALFLGGLILLIAVIPIVTIYEMALRLKFTRKKLLRQLQSYNRGNAIPEWITKNSFYKNFFPTVAKER